MPQLYPITFSLTRPNDTVQYTSGDLIANDTAAGNVVPMSATMPLSRGFNLQNIILTKSSPTTTMAYFRVHFYTESPTVQNGDNGAWYTTSSGHLGDLTVDCTGRIFFDNAIGYGIYSLTPAGSGAVSSHSSGSTSSAAPTSASDITPYFPTQQDTTIYALLEARDGYTPIANETFSIQLSGYVDV